MKKQTVLIENSTILNCDHLVKKTQKVIFILRDLLRAGYSKELIETELLSRISEWNMGDREKKPWQETYIRDVAFDIESFFDKDILG